MLKKVVIIGANGQLGTDLVKVFSNNHSLNVISLTHKDIEITNRKSFVKVLDNLSPEIIINTAAYHRVDEIENFPLKAFEVNALSNKFLAEYAAGKRSTLVFLSTDYVFGGDLPRRTPYSENDCPLPVNAYGTSKLAGEIFVRSYCEKYFIIRTCGLFGVAGSSGKGGNFVEKMIELSKSGRPIRVVDDQILSPTYTLNLAQAIAKILKTKKWGLYHAVSEGQCSWYEFATGIFRLLKRDVRIHAISSDKTESIARRPNYSVLVNKKLNSLGIKVMNDWQKNLELYLKEKGYI